MFDVSEILHLFAPFHNEQKTITPNSQVRQWKIIGHSDSEIGITSNELSQNAKWKRECLTVYAHFKRNMNGNHDPPVLYWNPPYNRERYNGFAEYKHCLLLRNLNAIFKIIIHMFYVQIRSHIYLQCLLH